MPPKVRAGALAAGLAGVALLLSGCIDQPTTGAQGGQPTLAKVAAAAPRKARKRLKLISNKEKYRDRSKRPATGRAGSAVMSARALLSRSGLTTLEVVAGTFD